jgi:mRNA interferase RelE/StbE
MRWSAILAWRIELTATAAKQLGKLDKNIAKRITTFLRQRLAVLDDPRSAGKALTGPQLGSYWRYRVGDFRIICDIQDGALCILVIEIGNRREIYR